MEYGHIYFFSSPCIVSFKAEFISVEGVMGGGGRRGGRGVGGGVRGFKYSDKDISQVLAQGQMLVHLTKKGGDGRSQCWGSVTF
jgi:hypothetical protein